MKGIALGSEIILDISSTQEMYISRLRETAPVNSLDPIRIRETAPVNSLDPILPVNAHAEVNILNLNYINYSSSTRLSNDVLSN